MDNTPKSDQGGCGSSIGGGISALGIIIIIALWSALAEYIIAGVVILVLVISLVVNLFGEK